MATARRAPDADDGDAALAQAAAQASDLCGIRIGCRRGLTGDLGRVMEGLGRTRAAQAVEHAAAQAQLLAQVADGFAPRAQHAGAAQRPVRAQRAPVRQPLVQRRGAQCAEQLDAGVAPVHVVEHIAVDALVAAIDLGRGTQQHSLLLERRQSLQTRQRIQRQLRTGGHGIGTQTGLQRKILVAGAGGERCHGLTIDQGIGVVQKGLHLLVGDA